MVSLGTPDTRYVVVIPRRDGVMRNDALCPALTIAEVGAAEYAAIGKSVVVVAVVAAGATVVGETVVGETVVGATVVVVGPTVVGAAAIGAAVVEASVVGGSVITETGRVARVTTGLRTRRRNTLVLVFVAVLTTTRRVTVGFEVTAFEVVGRDKSLGSVGQADGQ